MSMCYMSSTLESHMALTWMILTREKEWISYHTDIWNREKYTNTRSGNFYGTIQQIKIKSIRNV